MVEQDAPAAWPREGSQIAGLIRSETLHTLLLGPPQDWNDRLRFAVDLVLDAASPMAIMWGDDFAMLYNEAFVSLLGDKHPWALGQSGRDVFPEVWDQLEPILEQVMAGKGAARRHDKLLPMKRSGTIADMWLTFSANPLRLADGKIAGILAVAQETTDRVTAQQSLVADRDLLQATLDSSADMVQVFQAVRDEQDKIVDFNWVLHNQTSEAIHGDVIGKSLLEKNPGVVETGIFDTFKAVVETGVPHQAERHYVREQFDGWFFQSTVKLHDGVATTTTDITERKNAEQQLLSLQRQVADARVRESELRLEQFGQASQDILWIRDANTLQWQYLTPAFEDIYGISREEALQGDNYQNWLDFVVPEDRPKVMDHVAKVRDGQRVLFEYRIRRPNDGTIRWLRNTDFPMRNAAGLVEFVGGVGQDFTEAKIIQQKLEETAERLRSATEVARLGLWDWNVETDDTHWSDEHFRMEGYEVGEVKPSFEAWSARVHPEDRKETIAALFHARDTGEEYVHDFRSLHPDGTVRWLSARGRFVYDENGKAVRMVGAMVDWTDRQQAEEQQRVLVGELQHRTRNLIAVVRSTAEKTARASANLDDFRTKFGDRLQALARVQGLLSRLKDHSRVTFNELIESELTAMSANFDRVELSGPDKVLLRSSTVQLLAMALHELATNAVKYGAIGQPSARLTVRWELQHVTGEEQPWLLIDWRESGVTMPDAGSAATGSGQGRELIEKALPYQIAARTSFVMERDGVHCTIFLPVSPLTWDKGS